MNIEVLKFSANWCSPCKILANTLKDVIGITNIDIEQDIETAVKYNVRSVPTLVFLRDGKEVHRVSGSMPLDKYKAILTEINDAKELNN
ncbi:MAG: thioredoxin family protein [Ignisphaera sp.]|nr:thioredoxin family protein [Ignisphaera sp.]